MTALAIGVLHTASEKNESVEGALLSVTVVEDVTLSGVPVDVWCWTVATLEHEPAPSVIGAEVNARRLLAAVIVSV
jgi:hypothetical protein